MRIALVVLGMWLLVSPAAAQTWSLSRQRPSLFEIIAIDPISEPRWPFGSEDLADDGQATTSDLEAAIDLRSVYADARAGRLWLRAYVAARTANKSTTALTFFFIDTDQKPDTGGRAQGAALWPGLSNDPSRGGYELAVGVRADGTLLGVYDWNKEQQLWVAREISAPAVRVERGVARDPLRLLGDDRVYAQVDLALSELGLDERCVASIFVRTWNDGTDKLAFGDVVNSYAATCRPRLNRFGDPDLLRSDRCSSDDTCPGGGRCRDGICVFGYECNETAACQDGQRCSGDVCVFVREGGCSRSTECSGLVCESGTCATCSESGARACDGDGVCAPDGRCLSPSAAYSGDEDSSATGGERVQGGAFSCSLTQAGAGITCAWLVLLPFAWRWTDRRRRRLRSERGGAP